VQSSDHRYLQYAQTIHILTCKHLQDIQNYNKEVFKQQSNELPKHFAAGIDIDGPDWDYEYSPGLRAIQDKYGAGNIGPWDDWHWGYVNGHLSALRWILGEDFDFLDT
jgi:hypothetical protein